MKNIIFKLSRRNFSIFLLFALSTFSKVNAQQDMLCRGHYWTEDEANLIMKEFAEEWDDQASWEARAGIIREGIIEGLQISKMDDIEGNFNPIISGPIKINGYIETQGYIVENIAIESFPGFYITGNLYRPVDEGGKH